MHCGIDFFPASNSRISRKPIICEAVCTYFPGGAHFLDHTALKHHFHSLIDSFVKLLPVAKEKDACSGDADNPVCAVSRRGDLQIAPAADWRPPLLVACVANPLLALRRSRFSGDEANLQSTNDASAIFEVNLSRRFWIEFDQLRASNHPNSSHLVSRAVPDQARAEAQVRGSAL